MRATEYEFVTTDSNELLTNLITKFESMTGTTLTPAAPERAFLSWLADAIIAERVNINYAANQNIPSRAEGANLDALGKWIFNETRKPAQPAYCTMRFNISAAQSTAIAIPAGTRVTDTSATIYWATTEDVLIPIGSTSVDVMVQCQSNGTVGNGYTAGQINSLVDVDNVLYFSSCANTTESDGGAEEETDEDFYERMRLSLDKYSTAGAEGSYIYWAKSVSEEIADVKAVKASAGTVKIYALMNDGTLASSTIKSAIAAACNDDSVRPLTDSVTVADASQVTCNISLTYYIADNTTKPLTEIQAAVTEAVNEYKKWQTAKLGRDINPSKLWQLLMNTGIKRATITAPTFTSLSDGSSGSAPQVATIGTVSVTNGGYEDE